MRKALVLACLVVGVLAFIFLQPATGFVRDAGVIGMIACIGVYVGWSLPLEDR